MRIPSVGSQATIMRAGADRMGGPETRNAPEGEEAQNIR